MADNRTRRVHVPAKVAHHAGLTACGAALRRVNATENTHHATCADCVRIVTRKEEILYV